MRIKKYGITLTRLKEKDIELVRSKRNLSEITSTMVFRDHITEEMQIKWFHSINNIYNNFFMIHFNGSPIGLINGKNIDFEKRSSEGGMFIWGKEYWGTAQPALCSLIMSDFNFIMNEFETNYIQILRTNTKAISHNKQLGYIASDDLPATSEIQWYVLHRNDYLKNVDKVRKGVSLITGDPSLLSFSDFDFEDDSDEDLNLLYGPLPAYLKEKINFALKRDGRKLLSL